LLIGTPSDSQQGTGAGAAYVFLRTPSGWVESAKLMAPGRSTGARFGSSLALSGEAVVIGAPKHIQGPNEIEFGGAAFLFRRQEVAWRLEASLYASDAIEHDTRDELAVGLGASVAIGANVVVAGSPQDDEAGTNVGAVYIFGGLTTAVAEEKRNKSAPSEFFLAQNFPNPFNPSTMIHFSLPQREHVTLKVFDVNGREVATLVEGEMAAGEHTVTFEPREISTGFYFYKLAAGKFSQTRKAVLLK
jgi:hypothetical protein